MNALQPRATKATTLRTSVFAGISIALVACALGGNVVNGAAPPADSGSAAGGESDASQLDSSAPKPRDAGMDARDAAITYSDAGACGLCDRIWVCNNLAQMWTTEADGRCVNQVNRTALQCNGTLDGASYRDVGTWTGDAMELALHFRDLGGGVRTYYCYPR
jgi:hypothetical protein